jgi:predicted dehydrogenase
MSTKYSIGVIGAGARAETFARQLYEETPRAKLFGVCDIDEDRLAKFCDYCGLTHARRFTDPAKFIAADEMDAVIVTVPEFVHADVTCAALAAGKHVYLEKPLAATMADCYRIDKASRQSKQTLFIGFNLRASQPMGKIRQLVQDGALGEVYHISGLEQVGHDHGASFMRRWHRRTARSGGFLNTKCCHDLDIIQWIIGHEHKVARIASFGGLNFFNAAHAPQGHGTHCHNCPDAIRKNCTYCDHAGFFFPVFGKEPIYKTAQADVYGNDLCVYNDDKDIIDNQTVIMEWDHGVRGDFNLKPFQKWGHRETRVWGEKGFVALSHESRHHSTLRLTQTDTGDETEFSFAPREGGHGGTDPYMLDRFMDAFETGGGNDSNVSHGLAATLLALKADESRRTGKVVEISPAEYGCA